jgi:hypothetical protein
MARKSRFTPSDSSAVHRRFEQIRARTLKKLEAEERRATTPNEASKAPSPGKASTFGRAWRRSGKSSA